MTRTILILLLCACTTICVKAQESKDSLVHQLQEVVVTNNNPVTKLHGTSLVSTIAGSPLQALGTCIDVLRQLPMIQIDDKNVSVIGKGVPEIYIDGRPLRNNDELVRLQSDDIKAVELEMAPGARYGSDAQAVLKIITKRNFLDGFSLTNRGEMNVRRKVSAMDMLNLNYRSGAWDFFTDAVFNRDHTVIKGTTTNRLVYDGRPAVVGTSHFKNFPVNVWFVEPGFNYFKDSLSFGGYYHFNREHADDSNSGTEWLDDNLAVERIHNRLINAYSHRGSVYFENIFGRKYTLHFDGDYKYSKSDNAISTSYPNAANRQVNSSDTRKSSLWAGKLTLDFPLLNGMMSVGTQDSYTRTSLDYRMLNPDVAEYVSSSATDARQTSLATLASWTRSFGKFTLSAGLRYEFVDYDFNVDGVRDDDVSRHDNLLTPDISLSWDFNERAQISLSYKMNTVKPPYSQLTGSVTYAGLNELEGGNPALRDEHRHNIQLFATWQNFMLQTVYSRSLDSYGFVKSVYSAPTLQLLMRPVNLDISDLNIYLVWEKKIRAWTSSFTVGMTKQWLAYERQKYNKPIFAYYFDNTISLPWGIMMTANVNGQSAGHMSTNYFGASCFVMNMSLGKSFLNKSLTLKISATDIFNTRNNYWSMNTCGVSVDRQQTYDSRGIKLSLAYRLRPYKSRYQGKNASDAEMSRL